MTRATLHPILHSRIGPDQFVSRMARLREDPRFKAVQPDAFDVEDDVENQLLDKEELDEGLELWFDWAFVDFWKNHYCMFHPPLFVQMVDADNRYDTAVYCCRSGCRPIFDECRRWRNGSYHHATPAEAQGSN